MVYCPKCGTNNTDEAKFCGNCGTRLNGQASVSPPAKGKGFFVIIITAAAVILLIVLVVAMSRESGSPKIASVNFTGSGRNTKIVVDGSGFGTSPVSMPFTGDLQHFRFQDSNGKWDAGCSTEQNSVTLNYQSWNENEIVVGGFSGWYGSGWVVSPGDSVTITVWNPATGQSTSWTGALPAASPVAVPTVLPSLPSIASVNFTGSGRNTKIVVNGSGFGTSPVSMPFMGNLQYFRFRDNHGKWDAGCSTNSVTLNYQSWNENEIVVGGFSGWYGGVYAVSPGDSVTITVWNPATGRVESWTGTSWTGTLPAASPVAGPTVLPTP